MALFRKSMRDTSRNAISLYLLLTLLLSAVLWTLIIWSGHLNMGFGLVIPAIMWCPAVATLLTCRLLGREFRSLAWRWPNHRYMGAAYFVPLAYTSLAYGGVWGLHLAGWNSDFVALVTLNLGIKALPTWASFALCMLFMATGGVIQNLSMTLGEEIGWRGFLAPELLKDMSFSRASLVSGFIWAIWHSPLLLFADYNAGTNRGYAFVCSAITCISMSVILTWFRLKSDSVWPPALLHASHNLFVPIIFDNLTRNTGLTLWYTTVFGAALAITTSVFAVYFWTRRTEVQPCAGENMSVKLLFSHAQQPVGAGN